MSLGYQSAVVNGTLVSVAPNDAFAPISFGNAETGPAFWPRQGVYQVPPVPPSPMLPSPTDFQATAAGVTSASSASTLPSAGSLDPSTGKVNFLHPTKSPVLFAVLALSVGMLALTYIHFR